MKNKQKPTKKEKKHKKYGLCSNKRKKKLDINTDELNKMKRKKSKIHRTIIAFASHLLFFQTKFLCVSKELLLNFLL